MSKERRFKGCLSGCLGFVLLVFIAVSVLTVFTIHKLGSNDKGPDVVWSESDFDSAMEKSKVTVKGEISDLNLFNIYNGSYKTNGLNKVSNGFSEGELSAVLNKANAEKGPVKNIKIKLNDDNSFELAWQIKRSFMDILDEHLGLDRNSNSFIIKCIGALIKNKVFYAKGNYNVVSKKHIVVSLKSADIGKVEIKRDSLKKVESELEALINTVIEDNGIIIDDADISKGVLNFNGKLPSEISAQ